MSRKRHTFSNEFKAKVALEALKEQETINQIGQIEVECDWLKSHSRESRELGIVSWSQAVHRRRRDRKVVDQTYRREYRDVADARAHARKSFDLFQSSDRLS